MTNLADFNQITPSLTIKQIDVVIVALSIRDSLVLLIMSVHFLDDQLRQYIAVNLFTKIYLSFTRAFE